MTVYYHTYTVTTQFGVSGIGEYSQSGKSLVDHITLPDGSSYQFLYEQTGTGQPYTGGGIGPVTGRIAKVTLPTGGTVTYTYGNTNSMMADGSPANMARVLSQAQWNWSGTWTYTRAAQSGQNLPQTTTTVIDGVGNEADLNFSGIHETQRKTYNGSGQSKSLVKDQVFCYNGNISNCQTAVVPAQVSSKSIYDYFTDGGQYQESTVSYDAYGNPLVENDYAYTSGPQPSVIRSTTITYNSSLCSSDKICDHPSSIQVKDHPDPGGTQYALTNFYYDPTNGNTTEVSRWVSGTTYLNTNYTYNPGGTIATAFDPKNTQTSYGYTGNSCNGAFPTTISVPADGGGTLTTSFAYNCTGAVVTQITDPNGNTTKAGYLRDPYFWRPETTTDQFNYTTQYSYYQVPTGNPNVTQVGQVESVLTNNANSAVDTVASVDGFGRISLQQLREGPNSGTCPSSGAWDTTEYLYDGASRVSWITLPYVSTGCPGQIQGSRPAVGYSYDGLGRYTHVSWASWGGVDTMYSYPLNDVTVSTTSAPAQSRHYEYDAVGNLTSVCEITSAQNGGVDCAQNSSGTGYKTTYTYDALGNLRSVNQSGQTRAYSYDGLSRLTQATNPETGGPNHSWQYFWDSISDCSGHSWGPSAGDMLKRVDAAGNITCFGYDALHRITDEGDGWAGSSAICRRFRYDNMTGIGTPPANISTSNRLGRMWEASTDNCGDLVNDTLLTAEWFTYDPRGSNTEFYESTPHSSGFYHVSADFWPDGTLYHLNPNFSGIPSQTYGVDMEGGRTATVTASSGQSPVTATSYNYNTGSFSLVTPVQATTYGSSDTDVFSYDNVLRMTRGDYKVGAQTVTYQLGWNANGTVASLNIIDPVNPANQQNCSSYSYDDLGRLTAVSCGSTWAQTFSYDKWGNIKKPTGNQMWNPIYDPANNNRYQSGWNNVSYDLNGNLLNDTFNAYSWDSNWGNPATVNSKALVYDALGRMVENTLTAGTREYLYAPGGTKVFAQMNGQTPVQVQYPLPGGGLAIYTGSFNPVLTYARPDWQVSSRLVTSTTQACVSDSGYGPFGEQYGSGCGTPFYDFTGQEQWTATGLDDFPFRKYHPVQGRWVSPDPAGLGAVDINNPQTWNRYAYLANNPLNAIDPLGLLFCDEAGMNCVDDATAADIQAALMAIGLSLSDIGLSYQSQSSDSVIVNATPLGSIDTIDIQISSSIDFGGPTSGVPQGGAEPNNCRPPFLCKPQPKLVVTNSNPQRPKKAPCTATTRIAGAGKAAWEFGDAIISFNLAGIHFGGAGLLLGAGCLEPTPFEPATCAASGFGAITLTGGGVVLTKLGVDQVRNEVIPGIEQAVTCEP